MNLEIKRPLTAEEVENRQRQILEISKLSFESMKHLTTLSTGSIVLMVAFLEKLFLNNREWAGLIGAALIAFILSIVASASSLVQINSLLTDVFTLHNDMHFRDKFRMWTNGIAFISFVLGIVFLVIFAFKNLY
jgi:hypothetical protein